MCRPIPLGQDKQLRLAPPLRGDKIKLRVHLVEVDEDTGEGDENNARYWSCLGEAGRKGQA